MENILPFPQACGKQPFPFRTLRGARPVYAPDRVHACLLRRIDASDARRRSLTLLPDDAAAFALWTRERDRGDKLRRALIAWLSRPF